MGKSNVQRNLHYDGKYTPVVFFVVVCSLHSDELSANESVKWMHRAKTKTKLAKKRKIKMVFDHHTSYPDKKVYAQEKWRKKNKMLFYCFDPIALKYELCFCKRHQTVNQKPMVMVRLKRPTKVDLNPTIYKAGCFRCHKFYLLRWLKNHHISHLKGMNSFTVHSIGHRNAMHWDLPHCYRRQRTEAT